MLTFLQLISLWAHEVDPLIHLKRQEIILRIQKNKGNAGHKNVITLLEGKQSRRFTARFQQLTISRFSAEGLGRFCHESAQRYCFVNLSFEVSK